MEYTNGLYQLLIGWYEDTLIIMVNTLVSKHLPLKTQS